MNQTKLILHDAAYSDCRDLAKKTISDKILENIEPIKFLEIENMMKIKEHQQVCTKSF